MAKMRAEMKHFSWCRQPWSEYSDGCVGANKSGPKNGRAGGAEKSSYNDDTKASEALRLGKCLSNRETRVQFRVTPLEDSS
eukprot:scaffold478487_cov43-Prasinocladus_malaysianus.AAC.1